jgi:hypothetical protein
VIVASIVCPPLFIATDAATDIGAGISDARWSGATLPFPGAALAENDGTQGAVVPEGTSTVIEAG